MSFTTTLKPAGQRTVSAASFASIRPAQYCSEPDSELPSVIAAILLPNQAALQCSVFEAVSTADCGTKPATEPQTESQTHLSSIGPSVDATV